MNTAPRSRKLSLFEFAIVCEELEGIATSSFESAQRLAGEGKVVEAHRALAVSESAATKLGALIESQLAAVGEKRPSVAKVNATLAA